MLKKRFILIGWCTLALTTVVLLVSAMTQKEHKPCASVSIDMSGANQHVFINENDVKQILKTSGAEAGKDISQIDLRAMEAQLQKNDWIKNAELYFDNQETLHVKISEREPLARVFTLDGNSFYIDSSGWRLPLSDQQSARVPVFTSFTSNKKILSAPDSLLLNDIKNVAEFISTDSFWNDMISQINITPQRTFEMVPVLGNQIIVLGNADSLRSKFDRLYCFYKQVWSKAGFEKYEKIDVQYEGQIVATIRGKAKPAMDSLKAMQLLGSGLAKMNAALKDTVYAAPVISHIKDSAATAHTKPNIKPVPNKKILTANSKQKATMKKPGTGKTINKKAKPKAVLPKH